jgi:hypothetical protein
MTDRKTYVEVRLGGGVPQFVPVDEWHAWDADRKAGYTVLNTDLTEEQVRQRETQHALNAAARATYADPVAEGVRADTGGTGAPP